MDRRKEVLIDALKEADEEVRKSAAWALEKLQARDRLEELLKKLSAGAMLEKIRVIYALSDLRGPQIAGALTGALKDTSDDVRAAAARALGSLGDHSTLQALVEALKDDNEIVVRAAVESLSGFRDQRLLGPLVHALKHKDPGVVERALEAVSMIGDKRAEDALVHFAKNGNQRMRSIALRGLGVMDR